MKELSVPYFFLAAVFFTVTGAFFVDTKMVCAETVTLSPEPGFLQGEVLYTKEELSHILKPATVRILQHIEGSVEIPSFIIDSEKKTVAIDPLKKPTIISGINENILGTGFFVSSDGYIATNAHFVSDAVSKTVIIDSFVKNAISEAVGKKKVAATIDSLFTEEIVDFMLTKTKFSLTKTLIVLDPKSDPNVLSGETPNLYSLGFAAKEVATNDLFYKQGLDIALIKIDGEVFPASGLESREPRIGEKIYTFKTLSMSTFEDITSLAGAKPYDVSILSAIVVRKGVATSTSVYYTDLTASPELSGAMVFDEQGLVIGITSYDAQENTSSVSILPGRAILEMLERVSGTTDSAESFVEHVEKGIALSKQLSCEEARVEFALATGVQSSFVDSTVFDGYVQSCNATVAALAAEETSGGLFKSLIESLSVKVSSMSVLSWVVLAGSLFLFLILVLFLVFRKKGHSKEERALEQDTVPKSDLLKEARRTPSIPEKEIPLKKNTEQSAPVKKATGEGLNSTYPSLQKTVSKTDIESIAPKVAVEDAGVMSGNISEADQKRLAQLWPDKYDVTKTDVKTDVKTEVKKDASSSAVQNVHPDIISYIMNTRPLGFSDDEIRSELVRVGWKETDVQDAFRIAK